MVGALFAASRHVVLKGVESCVEAYQVQIHVHSGQTHTAAAFRTACCTSHSAKVRQHRGLPTANCTSHVPIPTVSCRPFANDTIPQEPGSFLSVATETSTADHLISNSPLRFDLVSPPASAPRDVYALPESSSNTSDSFILHIFPSTSQHRLQITKSPLYGPWPEEDPAYGSTKSFATSTLEKLVPVDIAAQGMADWERGGQLLKASDRPRPQMKEELLAEITEERKARRAEKEKDQKMIAAGGLLAKFQACSENDGR